ncbi:MAG TPA: VOC family protein [Acidimicrobiales bacterium]|nr:VOC family protein [Acidimicrobiales bacterium]
MAPSLNHTIVWCRDKSASSAYLVDVLGLPDPVAFGPFLVVEMANGVSLDYHEVERAGDRIEPQHYAFLVTEEEFEDAFGRIRARGQDFWADPGLRRQGEINRNDGGRGVYFRDPDGHLLELITRPYGSGG